MRETRLAEAYHIERAIAARQGISSYPCGCEKCHGFKIQTMQVVETHHRKYGRDRMLQEPLLNADRQAEAAQAPDSTEDEDVDDEEYLDADDFQNFEPASPNREVNLNAMAENFFARVDEIHQEFTVEEDNVLDFEDLSSDDEEPDRTDLLDELSEQAAEPLFPGSACNKLQFSIILMSLCTLFSMSHHCLDEILTFLKHDVLPPNNNCPKNSYELKTLLMKLGLSHQSIHCCDCGRTLYWKENSELTSCPKCGKSRYIEGSQSVPVRVLRYFSLIKRLRRMFRCPEVAKHLKWHSTNHSQDSKMRSVVDSEQWQFIDENFPNFSSDARNIRMGLSLDGVNPHSLQSTKHSVWPVMTVFYNLPPYLVTKRFFMSLTMIIPGPKSPTEDTIDIYLQPLVHELKKLWVGVSAIDMSEPPGRSRQFTMRGILMWTINDFPAYTLISGQVGKGYAGCPVCGEGTFAEHSREANKTVFLGHRRWLRQDHRWRFAKAAFNGCPNHDQAPPRQSGQTIVQRGACRESFLQCGGRLNSEHDPVKSTGVKRISILFQLPYWEKLPVRHLLDPMHCEKNICENILHTLLGETDGVKSREDLRVRNIRPHLHLQPNADGQTYFMPDAPYVLKREEREEFFTALKEIKFPTNYAGSLKRKVQEGKLTGLKTHDFHILMQQVLPVCLRSIGSPNVIGAIMRVSRLFRKVCSKVVDAQQKMQMLEEVAETMCTLEKEFPPSVFVLMMHLPIHLVEELFICGPVHTRWMYPFERYMKGLKSFVKNKSRPEGSMAFGYLREECIGFLNEYLAQYTPTTKRAWDDEEEPAMYDEILEGGKRDRPMSVDFQKLIHGFVLDNTAHMEAYRRSYEEAVTERNAQRELYRTQQRRRGRRTRFTYPAELQNLPDFSVWVLEEVRRQQRAGVAVDADVVDTARGPLEVASSYKSMYAFGNHFRVRSSETSLKTADSGVAATFQQICRNGLRDIRQVDAAVEYVGHIEEILELNYRRHCIVVLVCDFVKANYVGENATIVKDKWGFTLANYERRPGVICKDSFAFPKHCEQVFYCNAREAPGWKVVLRKEVRGRRVLPQLDEDAEPEFFNMGNDEDFEGLRPERDVGEGPVDAVHTGHDVVMQEVLVRGRGRAGHRRGGTRNNRGRREGNTGSGLRSGRVGRGGRRGRHPGRGGVRSAAPMGMQDSASSDEEDRNEEEFLYRHNLRTDESSPERNAEDDAGEGRRRIRRRTEVMETGGTMEYSSDSHGSSSSSSVCSSSSSEEEQNGSA